MRSVRPVPSRARAPAWHPKIVPMLLAPSPKRPRDSGPYVAHGSAQEGWISATSRAHVLEQAGALDWGRQTVRSRARHRLPSVRAPSVCAYPGGEGALFEIAGSQGEHGQHGIHLRCVESIPVQPKEQANAQEPGALVAFGERMILDERCAIGCREIGEVGLPVGQKVLRAAEGRFEEALVAQPCAAAMLGEAFVVQQFEGAAIDPAPLHFAS
jgi:hypothetical protein